MQCLQSWLYLRQIMTSPFFTLCLFCLLIISVLVFHRCMDFFVSLLDHFVIFVCLNSDDQVQWLSEQLDNLYMLKACSLHPDLIFIFLCLGLKDQWVCGFEVLRGGCFPRRQHSTIGIADQLQHEHRRLDVSKLHRLYSLSSILQPCSINSSFPI